MNDEVESSFSWLPPLLRSTFLRIQSFVGKRRLWQEHDTVTFVRGIQVQIHI